MDLGTLATLTNIASLLAVAAILCFVVQWFLFMRVCFVGREGVNSWTDVFPYRSVGFVGGTVAALILLSSHLASEVRGRIIANARAAPGTAIITVDGRPAANPPAILVELTKIASLPAHHSSPTKRLRIEIHYGSKSLVLDLGRDSGDPQEYWVFYPAFHVTSFNEIGRLRTSAFDMY
jgi:hypothetical protein